MNPYVCDEPDGRRAVAVEVIDKLARPFWDQGLALEIARFWVEFAFAQVRLGRLQTCPDRANIRSIAVIQRLGARFEPDRLDDDCVIATLDNPALAPSQAPRIPAAAPLSSFKNLSRERPAPRPPRARRAASD